MTYNTDRWHETVQQQLQGNQYLFEQFKENCFACRSVPQVATVSGDGAGGERYDCQTCGFGIVVQETEEGELESLQLVNDAMDDLSDTQLERLLDRVGIEDSLL